MVFSLFCLVFARLKLALAILSLALSWVVISLAYFLAQFLCRAFYQASAISDLGALASIASAAVLMHIILIDLVWGFTRVLSGFAYAGMYIVVESWLNDSATNKTRGQILSMYLIITMGGMGVGQLLAGLDDGQSSTLFLVASVAVSIAVVPILITVGKAPDFTMTEATSLRRLFQISPLAFVGMTLQGVVAAMMFGMGSVYGTRIGLEPPQVAFFMVSVTLGSLVIQYPVGRLSDVMDRRLVILFVTIISGIFACIGMFAGASNLLMLYLIMGLFGGLSLTLYSLCIAHANDYLSPAQMVGTASALIMLNGAGSVVGSPMVAFAMDVVGDIGIMARSPLHFIFGILFCRCCA